MKRRVELAPSAIIWFVAIHIVGAVGMVTIAETCNYTNIPVEGFVLAMMLWVIALTYGAVKVATLVWGVDVCSGEYDDGPA